jgi:hypothetical protein
MPLAVLVLEYRKKLLKRRDSMHAPVEHASAAAGFGGSCDWPLTFRPSRDQCLYELVEPCAETTWRARGAFLRGGTNGSNPARSSAESANLRSLSSGMPIVRVQL